MCLTGILFVLKTGIAWEDFPCEMGCCGMTLLNRLRQWQRAGVWDAAAPAAARPAAGGRADRLLAGHRRLRVGPCDARGKKRDRAPWTAGKTAPSTTWPSTPTACRWPATLTAANRHDVTQLMPLVDAIPPIARQARRPLRKPQRVMGDRAYDSRAAPHEAVGPRRSPRDIARRNTPHGSGLGVFRWLVEQTLALMHQFKRLRPRRPGRPGPRGIYDPRVRDDLLEEAP